MADRPAPEPVGEPVWLTIGAAARRLGVTREAVRRRVQRGTLESRREVAGNRVRLLVRLPPAAPSPPPLAQPKAEPVGERFAELQATVARLEATVAGLESLLAAERARSDELRAELVEERQRVDALLAALAEHQARRPWPGLRRWWRRVIEGEG